MIYLNLKSKELKITNSSYNDLIKRNWNSNIRYNKIFTDVTYIKTKSGWSYLSVLLDSFNNEIIGWELSKRNNVELVYKSFINAFMKVDDTSNMIIHSDHCFQYFSTEIYN